MYYSDNGRLKKGIIGEVSIKFPINSRNRDTITDTLAIELNEIDKNLTVLYYPTAKSKKISIAADMNLSKYVVLLALSFCEERYDIDTAPMIQPYFKLYRELVSFFKSTKGAVALDPFQCRIYFKDDSYIEYGLTFYSSYGKSIPRFALVQKNRYSNTTKREWISLTRYKELYPTSNINFKKPNFRVGEDTCIWCGKKLGGKSKFYCSDNCRLAYYKATDVSRSALLPYKIQCRDQFKCGCCGEDLALINEYGIKIPISKFNETPDLDGVYRRKAEVHHIVFVEDGGTDEEKNLLTLCRKCHKKKHKKVIDEGCKVIRIFG